VSTVETTEWYLFALAAILIAAVYYVGVKTDINAFSGLLTSVGNTFTGRPPGGGAFGGYPQGSTQSTVAA
jgi:hypothetical protein